MTLKIRVEGKIPGCYKCDFKSHIRADCPPLPVKDKEKEGEKVVGAPLPVEDVERKSEVTQLTKTSTRVEEKERDNEWETVGKKEGKKTKGTRCERQTPDNLTGMSV